MRQSNPLLPSPKRPKADSVPGIPLSFWVIAVLIGLAVLEYVGGDSQKVTARVIYKRQRMLQLSAIPELVVSLPEGRTASVSVGDEVWAFTNVGDDVPLMAYKSPIFGFCSYSIR